MRKFFVFMLAVVFAGGVIFAQEANERQRLNPRSRISSPAAQTVEGTLKLERGTVAVQSGETTYLVPVLTRYIGFINDLREGEKIVIEGFVINDIIHPVKAAIGGKSYDFIMPGYGYGMQFFNFGNMRPNFNMRLPVPARERPSIESRNLRQNRRTPKHEG